MSSKANRFTIESNRWYGWQMMPGYGSPYYSPIDVYNIEPRRNGRSELTLRFFNAFYAEGVQDFEKTLHVLLRGKTFCSRKSTPNCGVVS